MRDAADVYGRAWCQGLRPDPDLDIDEWADRYRFLPRKGASEPGPWRTDRTPFLREIMRALSPSSPVRQVSLVKGSQIGGTETGINFMMHIIDVSPGPTLMVQPTIETAERYSKQRIAPSIRQCPRVAAKVAPAKSKDSSNTILQKDFPGGMLIIGGANSAKSLRSMPIRYLFMDEVSAYEANVSGQGDPVALALKRTTNFPRKKLFFCSTPGIKGLCRITSLFEAGDQRHYYVPCPHCGHMQVLTWAQLKWPKGEPEKVALECLGCGELIPESYKTWMMDPCRAEWRPHNPDAPPEHRSYHLPSLYSPLGWYSWAEAVAEHYEAQGNPELRKAWVTHVLGETWEEEGSGVEYEPLYERREAYPAEVPEGALVLTAGIDTQDNRLELEVVGWGLGQESWSIAYEILYGDPEGDDVFNRLDQYLLKPWRHAAGGNLYILAACIDSQGHHTTRVQKWCKPREFRRIYPIQGKGGVGVPIISRPSNRNRVGVNQFQVGVDDAKSALYSRLRIEEPGPGFCHFPADRLAEYFAGLVSETRVTRYRNGRATLMWVKRPGVRNEPLDCRVYASAALAILNPNLEQLAKRGPVRTRPGAAATKRRRPRRVISRGVEV